MLKFTILTLFPEMFAPLHASILQKAQLAEFLSFDIVNFREYAHSKHRNVDDLPYGGGGGMLLKPEPIWEALEALPPAVGERRIVLLSPQGEVFSRHHAESLACLDELVLICGHYEGFDERVRELAQLELSLGDYVLTGGELAAMVVADAVARFVPGVLGKEDGAELDSFAGDLLEYPQYTRPPEFRGLQVPEVLLSGNHALIARWRRKESLRRTLLRRPDLFAKYVREAGDEKLLAELAEEEALPNQSISQH